MNTHTRPFRHPAARRRAFTLVEVLVVIALIAMLLFLIVPNLKDVMKGSKLTAAADQFVGDLNLARQVALKESVPVEVRLYKFFDPMAKEQRFGAYQCYKLAQDLNKPSDYTAERIAKPVFEKVKAIQSGVVVVESTQWSPILTDESMKGDDKRERVKGLVAGEMDTEAEYRSFIISPEGETSLDRTGAKQWYLTMVTEAEYQRAPDPAAMRPNNFIMIQVDPYTANTRRYMPN